MWGLRFSFACRFTSCTLTCRWICLRESREATLAESKSRSSEKASTCQEASTAIQPPPLFVRWCEPKLWDELRDQHDVELVPRALFPTGVLMFGDVFGAPITIEAALLSPTSNGFGLARGAARPSSTSVRGAGVEASRA